MRSSKFTFKKTRKVVVTHHGVCVDLTEEEARALLLLAEWRTRIDYGYSADVTKVCRDLVTHLKKGLDL